ncbi:MAG: hypothetical protein GY816_10600 [Cytophagales bacterium]|nr:hypothetical protein [Cytophagales bacterium]
MCSYVDEKLKFSRKLVIAAKEGTIGSPKDYFVQLPDYFVQLPDYFVQLPYIIILSRVIII